MKYIFIRLGATVFFIIAAFTMYAPSVLAGGVINIVCDASQIHSAIKDNNRVCSTVEQGKALPGDILVIRGSGFIASTKQSPVNTDQQVTFTGNGVSIKARLYPVDQKSPPYSTVDGNFVTNVIIPLELNAGRYDIRFQVRQFGCSLPSGVKQCPLDDAVASIEVQDTAQPHNISFYCPQGASNCAQNGSYQIDADKLRGVRFNQAYVYFKQGGVYGSPKVLDIDKYHTIHTEGTLNLPPGTYQVVLRNKSLTQKVLGPVDWEITGPSFTIIVPPKPQPTPPKDQPVVQPNPPQPPPDKKKEEKPKKKYSYKFIVPTAISGNQDIEIRGEDFEPGDWFQHIFFGGERFSVPKTTVKDDGTFSLTVHTPPRVDMFASFPQSPADFYWKEGITLPIEIMIHVYSAQNMLFLAPQKLSSINILCPLSSDPTLVVKPRPMLDQRETYPLMIEGAGFTCQDLLTLTITGIRVNGKAETAIFGWQKGSYQFRAPGIFYTDKFGGTYNIVSEDPISLYRAVVFDPDVTQVTFTLSDRHGRTVSQVIGVFHPLHQFSISVKDSSDNGDRETLLWQGFKMGPKAQLLLENDVLLGKGKKSIVLGLYNLDPGDKDEDGKNFLTFRVPETTPPGDYVLRLKQSDAAYATTLYSIGKKTVSGEKNDPGKEVKEEKKKEDSSQDPCKNLEGYMLRQCQEAYGLKKEEKQEKQKKISSVESHCKGLSGYMLNQCRQSYGIKDDVVEIKKEEQKVNNQLCANLEGYMLRTCEEAYGIKVTQEKPTKKSTRPIKNIIGEKEKCKGLEGYMLRQCQDAYGIVVKNEPIKNLPPSKQEQQKKTDSNPCKKLEGYLLHQCQQAYGVPLQVEDIKKDEVKQDQKKQESESKKICDSNLPKLWQQECVTEDVFPVVIPSSPSIVPAPVSLPQNINTQSTQCPSGSTYSSIFQKCFENTPAVQEEQPRPTCPEGQSYSITFKQCVR